MFHRGPYGFRLTFANGYSVSVQWSNLHYCSMGMDNEASSAEVAIFDPENNFVRQRGHRDDVCGWQTSEQVAKIINRVSKYKKIEAV